MLLTKAGSSSCDRTTHKPSSKVMGISNTINDSNVKEVMHVPTILFIMEISNRKNSFKFWIVVDSSVDSVFMIA